MLRALIWLAIGLAVLTAGWLLLYASPAFGPQLFVTAFLVALMVCALGCAAIGAGLRLFVAWIGNRFPEVRG